MKRALDLATSLFALVVLSPLLLVISVVIFAYDGHSPFYRAKRVGKNGALFTMIKFRSMRVGADKTGVSSTAANDGRITPIGHLIRRFKLDELSQFYNILLGDMSLVGPRPNVEAGTAVYTHEERKLLSVRPGITDLASIVFADEGEILRGHSDPDAAYDRLIRPWKSRLGLLYVEKSNLSLDIKIVCLTALGIVSRGRALGQVARLVEALGGSRELVEVSTRRTDLVPAYPPGMEASVGLAAGD